MSRTLICTLTLAMLCFAVPANSAIVNLDIQVNETAKTYSVFASIDGLTFDGLASFKIDVLGSGGVSVTSGVLAAPRVFDGSFNGGDFKGFSLFRTSATISGTNALTIGASQDTVSSLANDATIRNFGISSPVILATGAYTGLEGALTARLTPGNLFNLLPDNWVGPSSTIAATSVVSDTFTLTAIPEPSTVAFAGLLCVGVIFKNRRRVARQLD